MNAVRCKSCESILVSYSADDLQTCSCENKTYIRGVNDRFQYGGVDISYVELLNDYEADCNDD